MLRDGQKHEMLEGIHNFFPAALRAAGTQSTTAPFLRVSLADMPLAQFNSHPFCVPVRTFSL